MRKVFGWENPPETKGEEMNPISIVETAGYLPADVQIEQLIDAGKRLGEYRKDMYDMEAGEDIDDVAIDPTRSGAFDLADGTMLGRIALSRLEAQKRDAEIKAKKEAENAAMAQEKPSEAK